MTSSGTLFKTPAPTVQELLDLRDFYPDKCDFYWDRKGELPEISLILYRD